LAVGLAAAQERDPMQVWRGLRQRFDVDLDGRISRAEYTRAPAVFRRLDKNRDGYLTEADFQPSAEAAPTVTEVANTATAEQLEFFESKVRPVLAQNCFECHNPDQGRVKGSFRADSRQALLTGGPSGPALVPGDVEASLLIKAVRYGDEDYAMPPKQKLPEEQISSNRTRFYPELAWDLLAEEETSIKDGAVEMFLKSLELISTFNPDLTAGQLLEVERKMAVTKKRAFERWVMRSLKRREKAEEKARRRFDRERSFRAWMEWFALDVTRQAVVPLASLLAVAVAGGWWWGSQQNCRQLIVDPGVQPALQRFSP
jgi:mono/diheme cytochrome c family protein